MPIPDIAKLIADARVRAPTASADNIMVERPGRADMRISIRSGRPTLLTQQDEVQYDARGHLLHQERPRDLVVGTKMLSGIGQLHFGWFGGLPVRIAYGLLGIALCIVTSSGVTIWLARRRDRGRPAPQWERIWAAICWGQPVILLLTAMVAFALPQASLPPIWLSLTTLSVLAAGIAKQRPGLRIARGLQWALAVGLLIVALIHGIPLLASGKGQLMDLLLFAGGVGILSVLLRTRAQLRN
jgi:uncharacterized iron-regulated membrane protein